MLTDLQFEEYWDGWSKHEEQNYIIVKSKAGKKVPKYLKKGYTHFDLRFWFPDRKDELKKILKNKLRVFHHHHKREEWWAFNPFLKILLKTPRYKFQQGQNSYELETKIRPISFASHLDGLIFGFYAYAITRKYEEYIANEGFDNCVLAYRSNLDGKCNIQFSKEVFDEIKLRGNCTAIALDIKGYFDHIDHTILKDKWSKVLGGRLPEDQLKLYKALTHYSYVSKNSILKKYDIQLKKLPHLPKTLLDLVPGNKDFEKFKRLRSDKLIVENKAINKKTNRPIGIPQGSGMSALLSNIYLIDFDKDLNEKAKKEGFLYRRYCDDILIVCDSAVAESLQKFVIAKIDTEYFQEIQEKKVELTEFRANSKGKIRAFNKKAQLQKGVATTNAANEKYFYKSLQYLGFEFNGQNIFIRTSSLSRYFRKMKARIVKTVSMAYSDKSKSDKIWKAQMLNRYTHLGKRNFLKYAYNASQAQYENSIGEIKEGMDSPAIRKQVARHFNILLKTLEDKNIHRYLWKEKKRKVSQPKTI
jgi:RNA-directed DNA polymerase